MIINLKFFNKMRSIMSSSNFNPEDYTEEEIEILAENLIIIHSKYCCSEFRNGVIEYFSQNGKLNMQKLEGAKFVCDKFKDSEAQYLSRFREKLSKNYEPHEVELISDIIEYYYSWCADLVNIKFFASLTTAFELLVDVTGSQESMSNILSDLPTSKDWGQLFENGLNIGWEGLNRIQKCRTLEQNQKNILRNMTDYASTIPNYGWIMVNNTISLANLDNHRIEFFKWLEQEGRIDAVQNYNITQDPSIMEEAISKISEILTIEDTIVKNTLEPLEIFTQEQLNDLTSYIRKYKMPSDIFEKLVIDLTDICTKHPTLRELESIKFTLAKVGGKKTEAYFLPNNDPAALFIGKMTKSCQFYTGHSSDSAVMPFYKDTNTGVIVIKKGVNISVGCFAWICRNQEGKLGIVLDSIESMPEMQKIIPEFLEKLSTILQEKGLDLYLGSGGGTPTLHQEFVDKLYEPLPTLERYKSIFPISENYIPYYDSDNLYKITPGSQLTIKQVKDVAHEPQDLFIQNMVENADKIGHPPAVVYTLLKKYSPGFLQKLSGLITQDDGIRIVQCILELEQDLFTKMSTIASTPHSSTEIHFSQMFVRQLLPANYLEFLDSSEQESLAEEFKDSSHLRQEAIKARTLALIDLFSKRLEEIYKDPELSGMYLDNPVIVGIMPRLINSGLSMKAIYTLSKICIYCFDLDIDSVIQTDRTHYLTEEDCALMEKILSKIEIKDAGRITCDTSDKFEDKLQTFISIVKKYEQEIIENPSLIQEGDIFSGTSYIMMNLGLSLKSILAMSKLADIYSDGTDQNWTLEPQDAEFLEKIFSKIEIKDEGRRTCYGSDQFADKLQKFISIVKKYEQEI
ncbi:MAG: hypothetical protein SFT68_00945, partial [Rickettsiaceae bacterium]|nr:hypothetical protein [Rickettsiaceae bacterium]